MKAGGALVLAADPGAAARRAVSEARAMLGDSSPSFAVLFASEHFFGNAEVLVAAVAGETGQIPLIGCVAEAVAGGSREVESEPAVALWLAAGLGPVETFAMEFARTASGGAFGGYRFEQDPAGARLMICDPFTFPVGDLLTHLNQGVDIAGNSIGGTTDFLIGCAFNPTAGDLPLEIDRLGQKLAWDGYLIPRLHLVRCARIRRPGLVQVVDLQH